MLSLLFALGTSAQPSAYRVNGPLYSAGTPAAVYPAQAQPVMYNAGPVYAQRPPQFSPDDRFALNQADREVRAGELDYQGNNLFYNVPWGTLFPGADPSTANFGGFLQFGNTARTAANQLKVDRIQREIDRYIATRPQLTREDQNRLDDLVLQRDIARNQARRRFVNFIPGATIRGTGAPMSAYFEREAHQDEMSLAQNSLYDARQSFQAKPSQDTWVQVRNARDDVEQADDRADANTYDLLGAKFNRASRLGPIFRKRASETKLDTGYRNRRLAQDAFDKDPSEDNRMKLQLANLFVRATEQEDDANRAEIVFGSLLPSKLTAVASVINNNKNFQDESGLWLRYARLKRQILRRQQAQALQSNGASPVADQMLGLTMYGRSAGSQNI